MKRLYKKVLSMIDRRKAQKLRDAYRKAFPGMVKFIKDAQGNDVAVIDTETTTLNLPEVSYEGVKTKRVRFSGPTKDDPVVIKQGLTTILDTSKRKSKK